MHGNDVFGNRIVNGVGKTLRKRPVKSMTNGMNAAIKGKRIDIRVKRIQKIMTEIPLPLFIEFKPISEVEFCLVKDPNSHDTRSRISFLAVSQSVNC